MCTEIKHPHPGLDKALEHLHAALLIAVHEEPDATGHATVRTDPADAMPPIISTSSGRGALNRQNNGYTKARKRFLRLNRPTGIRPKIG